MINPDNCPSCHKQGVSPWTRLTKTAARTCDYCRFLEEKTPAPTHVDCPCWVTGKFVWVEGCDGHPSACIT